jgi:hypothetical protein
MTLREVAASVGCSHFVIWRVLEGETVRRASAAKIEAWLDRPKEVHAAQDLRRALQRVVGRLGRRAARQVEVEVGEVVTKAFKAAGEEPPAWVAGLGKKQV